MSKVIGIKNVSEFKEYLMTLSSNVVKPAFGEGNFVIYFDKGYMVVYARGNGNFGYFLVEVDNRWSSPAYFVPQCLMTKIIGLIPKDKPASLEITEDGMLVVHSGEDMSFSMRIGDAGPKPKFNNIPDATVEFSMSPEEVQAIQQKICCCATNAFNLNTEGVGLIIKNGKATVNTTDKYSLASMELSQLKISTNKDIQIATPIAAWNSNLSFYNESIHYKIAKQFFIVRGNKFSYLFNNFDTSLPPYQTVIQRCAGYTHKITVSKNEFQTALKGLRVMACAATNAIEIHFLKNELVLYTEDKELGSIKMHVPYSSNKSNELDGKVVGFAFDYLQKGVKASDENVNILLSDPASDTFAVSPIKFITGNNSLMIASPVRLNEVHNIN